MFEITSLFIDIWGKFNSEVDCKDDMGTLWTETLNLYMKLSQTKTCLQEYLLSNKKEGNKTSYQSSESYICLLMIEQSPHKTDKGMRLISVCVEIKKLADSSAKRSSRQKFFWDSFTYTLNILNHTRIWKLKEKPWRPWGNPMQWTDQCTLMTPFLWTTGKSSGCIKRPWTKWRSIWRMWSIFLSVSNLTS